MADPDLQIKGGGGHPDPEIRGGGLKTIFFQPFRPQFGPKIRGERAPQAPSLDPPLWCSYHKSICIFTNYCTLQDSPLEIKHFDLMAAYA